MDQTNSTLEERIVGWLAKQGYRLEYLTNKALKDAGLHSVLGGYVESSDSKAREIDVTAFLGIRDHDIVAKLLCECKYSVSHPWVLLASGLSSHLWADWTSTPQSRNLFPLAGSIIEQYAEKLQGCWHFSKGHYFAHSLVQALKPDNRDPAFDSLQKIANAAWDYVETPERRGANPYLIAFPCIVVEAPLFFAWFNYDADCFAVQRVPYGRISWSGCRSGTVVDVVHVNSIADYAGAIKNTLECVVSVINQVV